MRRRSRFSNFIRIGIFSVIALSAGFLSVFVYQNLKKENSTQALSATEFQAGRIIDDSIFYNPDTMTAAEIDAFIDSHSPACDMWGNGYSYGVQNKEYARIQREAGNAAWHEPPYVCISEFYENPETHQTNFETNGERKPGMLSAGEIIYKAAHTYNVNPQVLLVMLKKESYAWGDDWPLKWEYNTVMGYACPDGAPCNEEYFGFYNQMMTAAWQLNYYREHIYSYNYRPYATNNVWYSPDHSCGTKSVYLENIATTSLYIYTPYTPNDAALANYPGTSYCGSYGNRNFYMYFREWFGDAIKTTPSASDLKARPNKSGEAPVEKSDLSFSYSAHVANVGWVADAKAGEMIGSQGYGLAMEAYKITLPKDTQGGIEYRAYVRSQGWETKYRTSSEVSGTTGKSLPLEAVQIRLTGELARNYEVQYRAHVSNVGWMEWVKGDAIAGKVNGGQSLEGLQVKLIKKATPDPEPEPEPQPTPAPEPQPEEQNNAAQGQTTEPTVTTIKTVSYRTHVQDIGWQGWKDNGIAGTTGLSKRVEAIEIKLDNEAAKRFGIKFRAHVQNIGWQGWVEGGKYAGTTGKSLRMEAIQIKLDDEAAKIYNIRYRAHVQNIGWQNWVSNGQTAGTTGKGLRLEAIDIRLEKK